MHRSKATHDYIHADVLDPSSVPSKGGARYFLSLIDNYSIKVWVYMLKQKSDVFKIFKKWKVLMEKQTEKKVKHLHSDNNMEFCLNEFGSSVKMKASLGIE